MTANERIALFGQCTRLGAEIARHTDAGHQLARCASDHYWHRLSQIAAHNQARALLVSELALLRQVAEADRAAPAKPIVPACVGAPIVLDGLEVPLP